jgi:hypothetical protein
MAKQTRFDHMIGNECCFVRWHTNAGKQILTEATQISGTETWHSSSF